MKKSIEKLKESYLKRSTSSKKKNIKENNENEQVKRIKEYKLKAHEW